jgi:tRNA dimethylallyltransferase
VKPHVLFLVGPTACGKSRIGGFLAEALRGEIVSADSMLVYRGMDVLTAKPSEADRQRVRHHLIDVVSPQETFSVFDYYRAAASAISQISSRGALPLVVGGTGLYVRSLLRGLSAAPGPDLRLRSQLENEAQDPEPLYQRLMGLDPVRAKQIQPKDRKRIIRALEIAMAASGNSGPESLFSKHACPSLAEMGFDPLVLGLRKDRTLLYRHIEARVESMFLTGLADEVSRLSAEGVSKTASQALGYKELLMSLRNEISPADAKDLIKLNTRRFAKRQETWFRREPVRRWFEIQDGETPEVTAQAILDWYRSQNLPF